MLGDYQGKYHAVMIFGPPGAGKGTISRVLAQAGGMIHLSTGDVFRGISPETPAGQLTRKYSSQGLLVPDDATIEIWRYYVNGLIATNKYLPEQQLLLLDGIPRTLKQAELIKPYINLKAIIDVRVDDEAELVRRLKGRAAKEGRVDDAKDDVLRKRLEVYHAQTADVLSCYPSDLVYHVNGDQPPLHVLGEILTTCADVLTLQGGSVRKL